MWMDGSRSSESLDGSPDYCTRAAAAAGGCGDAVFGSEGRRNFNAAVNVVSSFALVGVAIVCCGHADAVPAGVTGVYRLGDWPAPFGIVLVADRLSALMLLLTSLVACAAVIFSLARWHRAGSHFHSLFQFLLMGLNGAFLTGDLFNLFVFFEVLLAASYGLALHGSGHSASRLGCTTSWSTLPPRYCF